VPAYADTYPTGAIAGKVTIAGSGTPIEDTSVCIVGAWAGFGPIGPQGPSCEETNSAGEYEIWGLISGEYKVAFFDGLVCAGKQYGLAYVPQYYNDKATEAEATAIQVAAPATVTEINASVELAKAPEPPITEYFCNEGDSEPTGTRTFSLPGSIEPLPVNTKVAEEFYASHPSPVTPIPGIAVPGSSASVKDASAVVSLQCRGGTVCHGRVELWSATARPRVRRGGTVAVKRSSRVVVGTASFWLAAGASETIQVPLTGRGKVLLARRGDKAGHLTLTGTGVKSETLLVR
jgi:hypothetical protein